MDAAQKIFPASVHRGTAGSPSVGEQKMTSPPPPDDCLSPAEVDAVLRALSPADWERALRLARFRASGLTDWTPESLLAEALAKLLAGERVWKRGVSALQTLKNVLHSLASNDRKKQKGAPIDRFATVDVGAGEEDGEDRVPGVAAVDDRSPERIMDGRSQLAAIEKLVADDEDAQMVLLAWSEGIRGKAAADDLGFDPKRYDAARQRLMRKLEPIANLRKNK
ncbi:hypothetical protein [Piscinibacter sp. HJYY11]|uniref:hypothetical protein n=1 Tax=Piscinibacter sp. HJYY11 TaxID=2801333 RepID=UPI00191D1242|nr:hypothetical protein [Piscinibacter sp. HJYY11]MBL0726619.1 hypothetical protein [Piscinibacter sp. HJYY11]